MFILAGAADPTSLARAIDTLQRADYIYRGEQGIPGRHFFRRVLREAIESATAMGDGR